VLPSLPDPNGAPAAPAGSRGRALVVTGLALVILAAAGGTAELALALAVTALSAAGLLALRARRSAAQPGLFTPSDPAPVGLVAEPDPFAEAELTERLSRLYDDHVEKLNMALAEDRDDLVQELSDSYMDEALHLMTSGGRSSLPLR
jgi:hypothetical protein